jgi:hypothetical protein
MESEMEKQELYEMLRTYLSVDVGVDNGDEWEGDRIRVKVKIKFDGVEVASDYDSATVNIQ